MDAKQRIHHTLWRLGWEVQRLENTQAEYQVLRELLRESKPSIVLDVGANVGQFGELVLAAGFDGDLVSFEAIPEVHSKLVEHARKTGSSWTVAPCAALGRVRGEAVINLAGNSVSSSLLPMRRAHVDAAPESAYIGQKTVKVERLDELASALIPATGPVMIKIDTQGYELEVLEGATALLPRTTAIQLELSLMPLYKGAPEFADAVTWVRSHGFELFSLIPGFKDKRTGRLLQADGVFVRRAEEP